MGAFLNDDGTLKPRSEWTPDMCASVASVEFDKTTGRPVRIKLWDKNQALTSALKHLGLFEQNNMQKAAAPALQVRVVFVPSPNRKDDDDAERLVSRRETARSVITGESP